MDSISAHFEGKDPSIRALYDKLLASLRKFGTVKESPKKTSIHLDKNAGFGGVYVRKNYINLVFRTANPIDNSRILKTEQISKSRYLHTVRLSSPNEIDAELLGWLENAYVLAR